MVRTGNLWFMYFTGVSHISGVYHEICTKCKKTSNLIKDISSNNICSGIKSQKTICHSVTKTFDFSQNSFALFHRVTFNHSIPCVLLINKSNESCQNSEKNGKKCHIHLKRAFKKKRKYYTSSPNSSLFHKLLQNT